MYIVHKYFLDDRRLRSDITIRLTTVRKEKSDFLVAADPFE